MNVVESEVVAAIVVPLVALLIGKAFAWWKARAKEKDDAAYAGAVEALEVAVDETWENVGKAWKARANGNKFTEDEKRGLREKARELAKEVGRTRGLDVGRILAGRGVNLLIRQIIDRRKRGAA